MLPRQAGKALFKVMSSARLGPQFIADSNSPRQRAITKREMLFSKLLWAYNLYLTHKEVKKVRVFPNLSALEMTSGNVFQPWSAFLLEVFLWP